MNRKIDRRRLMIAGAGLAGTAWLAACGGSDDNKSSKNATVAVTTAAQTAAAAAATQAQASDLNDKGFPKSITKLSVGAIPLEDAVQQKSSLKPLEETVSAQI